MKRISIAFAFALLINIGLNAQTTEGEKTLRNSKTDTIEGWKTGGVVTLNFTQTSLTNWAAGGENSLGINGLLSLYANYKKGNAAWDNSLDLGYGSLKQGKENWRKTDDKIDFLSKYGQKAYKNWYYAGLLNFKTQMMSGYDYPNDSVEISRFLAPGYLLGAIGLDYKQGDNFSLFIAPITGKVTFVNNQALADAGAFGVDAAEYDTAGNVITNGKMVRYEFGGYIRSQFKYDLMENISLTTKIDLFSNYLEDPQNIDISWETLIAMKINKYISATITTHLLYDHDTQIEITDDAGNVLGTGPRTQFKEVLGVGFSYKF